MTTVSSPTGRFASWGVIWPGSGAVTCPGFSSEDAGGDSVDDAMVVERGLERIGVMSEWTASERKQMGDGAFDGMDYGFGERKTRFGAREAGGEG